MRLAAVILMIQIVRTGSPITAAEKTRILELMESPLEIEAVSATFERAWGYTQARRPFSQAADARLPLLLNRLRAALARGLASFGASERPPLMLAALDRWTGGGIGLKGFLVLTDGVHLDEALRVLDGEGLTAHAALLREGTALFGPDFGGTQAKRYARWSDGRGEIRDEALDAALERLSERFRALPRLLDEAVAWIDRSSDLAAQYETLRTGADDDDHLAFLTEGLWGCLSHYDAPSAVGACIVAVRIFEAEMLNGSMHQAFFNSSGVLALARAERVAASVTMR